MRTPRTTPLFANGPGSIIRAGITAVPAVKYALGVAGVIAALAIVKGYFSSAVTALLAGAGMIILMVLLLVFAAASRLAGSALRAPALVFTWAIIVFFLAAAGMTISCIFFKWPVPISELLKQPSIEKNAIPSPPPVEAKAIPVTPLTIVVDSSGAAAKAATEFAQELGNPGASAKAAQKLEKEQLKRVIRSLVSIEYEQAPLPWLLRNYVRSGDFGNWGQVMDIIAVNTPLVSELVDLMEKFDGDLVYKDLDTYKNLRMMIKSRVGLYGELAKMKPPPTEQEKAQLLKIADNFDVLIKQMKSVEKQLSNYLQD